MKTTTTTFAILSSLSALSALVEGFVYPSSPVGATVWKPNTTVNITWFEDKQAPLLTSNPVFDIFLMTGSDDHQTKLATIASDVKGGTINSMTYQVPNVSPPGQIYFLMFQTRDLKSTAWATRFTITDANGSPGTLRPTIPPGGKINPGGVGAIIAASPKQPQQQPEGGKGNEKELEEKGQEQEQRQSTTTKAAVGSEVTNASPAGSGKNSTSGSVPPKAKESVPVSAEMGVNLSKNVNDSHGSGSSIHSGAALGGATVSSLAMATFIGFVLMLI
ncbi:hypothetical protein EDD21DRAFT_447337 [Dissophora ornata]|nr:hypothetical protein BGZ58_001673 [Dissophora ornata]KAI8597042.1 hypothetical protein EDD21DRAFT_447337 [Dissophora ornata]